MALNFKIKNVAIDDDGAVALKFDVNPSCSCDPATVTINSAGVVDAVVALLKDSTTNTVLYTSIDGSLKINAVANSSQQKVGLSKNGAAETGVRKTINLIEGPNVTLTVADNSGSDRIDVTIGATTGGSGSGSQAQFSGDNTTLVFLIPHGLSGIPAYFSVMPSSPDAYGIQQIVANDTYLKVYYNVAPPTGGNNITLTWFVGPVATSDSNAAAFITAAGITNAGQQAALHTLVLGLKGKDLWDLMVAAYPFVGGSASSHKFNLKDPRDLDAANRLTFVNSPTHSANGVDWNGSTQYADVHLMANAFTTTDIHFSYYSRENDDNLYEMGAIDGSANGAGYGIKRNSSAIGYALLSPKDNVLTGFTSGIGMFVVSKEGTNFTGKRNGAALSSSVGSAPAILPALTMYLGALNQNGTANYFSSKQCCFASFGYGLTSQQMIDLSTVVNNFQTALSRNTY